MAAVDDLYADASDPSSGINQKYKNVQGDSAVSTSGPKNASGHAVLQGSNAAANIAQADPRADAAASSYIASLGYNPNIPLSQQITDQATYGKVVTGMNNAYDKTANAIYYPDSGFDKAIGGLALAGSVATLAAGAGAAFAPLLGAAGAAGSGVAAGGGLGLSGTALTAATGAVAGGVGGAAQAALTGHNIGKGALIGGIGGAVGGALKPLTNSLGQEISSATGLPTGLSSQVAGGVSKAATGALTGAAGAGLSGGDVGAAALGGAEHGAINSATGAVSNSIVGAAGTVFNSGSTDLQTNNPSLTNPTAANMADDYSTNDMYDFGGGGGGVPGYDPTTDPNSPTFNGGQGAPGSTSGNPSYDYGGLNTGYQASNPYLNAGDPSSGGSGSTALGAAGGSALAKLLAGSGGNGSSGGSNGLLSQLASSLGLGSAGTSMLSNLLGLGANAGAGILNSDAAKSAAGTYASQNQFNPYSVTNNGGSTTFNGASANQTLSPGQQANSDALNGLTQSSAASLQGGQQDAANAYFNNLQANQQSGNQQYLQGNLDNEFGKGTLSSTAGQYQTQAALQNLGQQTTANQTQANNFASGQQQQQLAQLTASLNGSNNITAQQLQALQAGGNLGAQAGNVNLQANKPALVANSNSNFGGVLSALGAQGNNQYGTTGGG